MRKKLESIDTIIVDEHTLFFAFRYALGRMSTAPSIVVRNILSNWQKLSEHTKQQIKDEILEYRKREGLCGMKCDDNEWQRILDND